MRFLFLLTLSLTSILTFNTCGDSPITPTLNSTSSDCRYKLHFSYNRTQKYTTKNKIQISANIKSNFKVLGIDLGDLKGDIGSETDFGSLTDKFVEKVLYDSTHLSRHNAIVDILCDLEFQLRDSLISTELRNQLMVDLSNKRSAYFNFLLGSNSEKTDNPTNSSSSKKGKKKRVPIETPCSSDTRSWNIYSTSLDKLKIVLVEHIDIVRHSDSMFKLNSIDFIATYGNNQSILLNTIKIQPIIRGSKIKLKDIVIEIGCNEISKNTKLYIDQISNYIKKQNND